MARRPLLHAYCAAAGADVALCVLRARRARWLTKPVLMPLLAIRLARVGNAGDVKGLTLAGLGLSCAGDVALLGDGETAFTVGLASFLAAHGCYLGAFARRRSGGVRKAPWVAVAYLLAWCGLNAALWPRTGKFRLPVVAYGSALASMALAALDTGTPAIGAGGAAFLLSDSILALEHFDVVRVPAADALVMLTYATAQALIVEGIVSGTWRRGRQPQER